MPELMGDASRQSLGQFLAAQMLQRHQVRPNMDVIVCSGDPHRPETVAIEARGVFKRFEGDGDSYSVILGLLPDDPGYTPDGMSLLGGMGRVRDLPSGLIVPSHVAEAQEQTELRTVTLHGRFIADGDAYARWIIHRSRDQQFGG